MQLVIEAKSKRQIADKLKMAKVDKSYLAQEDKNIREYIERSKLERNSILMSNEKYSKSFSL
ncbi:MAG: hypothetical protein H6630_05075 [Arcobacter sp.]|nr:hypothetical protein [Arcobacter sp.]